MGSHHVLVPAAVCGDLMPVAVTAPMLISRFGLRNHDRKQREGCNGYHDLFHA